METQDPDLKIVNLVKQGNKQAFDLLVLKYQGKVMSLISRYIQDRSQAEDVAQEAFLRAYRSIDKFQHRSAFYTWLYRIAVNTAKNYLTHQGRRVPVSDVALDDDGLPPDFPQLHAIETPESSLSSSQLNNQLQLAINNLPAEMQQAFQFREFDGLSYEEIALMMDTPIGTVRSRIFRAREQLESVVREFNQGDYDASITTDRRQT